MSGHHLNMLLFAEHITTNHSKNK